MLNEKLIIIVFSISIFLLRVLPFYYLGITNIIFTSHVLAVFIICACFILIFLKKLSSGKIIVSKEPEQLFIFIFFLLSSLSIINAMSIEDFLQRYIKIVFGLVLYFTIKLLRSQKLENLYIPFVIIVGGILNVAIQSVLVFSPGLYTSVGKYIIYSNVFSITQTNFQVGKIFDDSYIQIVVPFLILLIFRIKKTRLIQLSSIIFLILLGFVDFASNFRYRILTFIGSAFASFMLLSNFRRNFIVIITIIIIMYVSFTVGEYFTKNTVGFTVVDRFLNESPAYDYGTIQWRLQMFGESINMGTGRLLGVGLGNFFNNLKGKPLPENTPSYQISIGALQAGPHNIFFQILAETGVMGLLSFLVLIGFFLKKDWFIFPKINDLKKCYIIAFWTLILLVQFFPAVNLTFYVLFFLLRAPIYD